MSLSRVYSGLVTGVEGKLVTVETHIDNGLPGVSIVGLPDQAVRESRDRIRPALKESGFRFPNRKITINLSPADQAKEGSTYDLPIAVGILLASGQLEISQDALEQRVLVGEIALDGKLRGIHGVLPVALKAQSQGFSRMMLPRLNHHEAACTGIDVESARHLREAVGILEGRIRPGEPDPPDPDRGGVAVPDFRDVRGQHAAKRGLCLAAAGGHNVLMVGPPGTGKSMLAQRIPGILPPLSRTEALETTAVHSVAGELVGRGRLIETPPFRAPHHTISGAELVGGGSLPRPGEASLAHNGVLFLDELPEFQRSILETLRQPLETGSIRLSRARATETFPANFLLIAAMNPCPCGYLTHPERACLCRPVQIDRYRQKFSGPLLDRIDLHLTVGPVPYGELRGGAGGTSSEDLREQVVAARDRQATRFQDRSYNQNAEMGVSELERYCPLNEGADRLLRDAVESLGYSARAVHRVRKVSRTMADLDDSGTIGEDHVAEALQYREFVDDQWTQ